MSQKIAIHWFRRDLRINDNTALYRAFKSGLPVLPVFIFDKNILEKLDNKSDRRVQFIYREVLSLKQKIEKSGGSLHIFFDTPENVFKKISEIYNVGAVFTNRDYEPYALHRDHEIYRALKTINIPFETFKDHIIFEPGEITKDDLKPYTVFTPFSKKWKEHLDPFHLQVNPSENYLGYLYKIHPLPIVKLEEMGFVSSEEEFPSQELKLDIISNYHKTRDIPGVRGTSRLSLHYRFGTISIREIVQRIRVLNETYLNELIWREFYIQILWYFPHVVTKSFNEKYDRIVWRNDSDEFEKWCSGHTGIPIVDAGMRELNATGFMHNRVRMIVASFLTKNLLIDWRWGEAYFASKLLDFELASNNGGWQWAAGCGTDAAPYFRVFNPILQAEKFDPQNIYIKKWVPEFGTKEYGSPIVDLKFSRERCLKAYSEAVKG